MKIDKNIDTKTGIKETNERRLNALVDLVGRYVRTERHLEQHSDIVELNEMKHTLEVQNQRKDNIDHLKSLIINGHGNDDDLKNLKRNYTYTHNYLTHHQGHMDQATLTNTKEKQEHRKEQMQFLQFRS